MISTLFSFFAVWFLLLDKANSEKFSGNEGLALLSICIVTGMLFAAVAARSFKRRMLLLVVSSAVGAALPVMAIIAPLFFCLVFQCEGFDWP
ncbi:MAG: hypothetical protein M9951_10245 [Burkholderiaceae bacterium]|nr:hypothetical protein [Burkholderiaceae bacterium]